MKPFKNTQYRFIYSSCPTRGLELVIKNFIEFRTIHKEAELYIYSDFNNNYVNQVMGSDRVKMLLHFIQNTKGIVYRGRLPEEDFLKECKNANFWYYPTYFKETFCITAVQMMANGVIPIYSDVGALTHVIGDAGIKCTHDQSLSSILDTINDDKRNSLMKKCVERVKIFTDIEVKRQWLAKLNEFENKRNKK